MSHPPVRSLHALADEIRATWAEAKSHQIRAVEGYLVVGRLLSEARQQAASDHAYGEWFRAQGFPFGTEWGRRLRRLAAYEPAVLSVVASALASGEQVPGVDRLLGMVVDQAIGRTPRTALANARDPRTTAVLLGRLVRYQRDLAELLEPGADYVARQIAEGAAAEDSDTPGWRTPARRAQALRDEATAFRDIADAVDDLANRLAPPEG